MNLKSITFPGLEGKYSMPQTAEDVGARPDTWMPTAEEVGARPDTWMPSSSDVGAAPSGYGIGKLVNYEVTSDTEIDNVLISTIASMEGHSFKRIVLSFKSTTNFTNGGGHYYTDIYKLSTNYAMITIKSYINDGKTMQRCWYEGALKPWEWVNPPMALGVEYRTTERWKGKAVYKRLGSYTFTEGFGDTSTVSNVVVSFGHISATQILSAEIVRNSPTETDRGYIVPTAAASGALLAVNAVLNNGAVVLISNKYAVPAGSVMYCTLRYTKD